MSWDVVAALNEFCDRWRLDGAWLVCLRCHNASHVLKAGEDFHHRADCAAAPAVEARPWERLRTVLTPGGSDERSGL